MLRAYNKTIKFAVEQLTSFCNKNFWLLIAIYSVAVTLSFWFAYEVRFDFVIPPEYQLERFRLLPYVIVIKLIILILVRQTGSVATFFSIPDFVRLGWGVSFSIVILVAPRLFGFGELSPPRSVLLIDGIFSFGSLCGFRLLLRLVSERLSGNKNRVFNLVEKVAVIGAGEAGANLVKEFLSHPRRGIRPVIFLDDDKKKHGKLIHGIPIVGVPEEIGKIREAIGVRRVIIAMSDANHKRIRELVVLLTSQGYKVEIMPAMAELATGRVKVSKVRPVDIEDLLGREQVELDVASIRKFIENKTILVTGAGGSIGSELCRQIARLNPKRLLLVERSEVSLFIIEQEMKDKGYGSLAIPLACDVLDKERLEYLFKRYTPQVVFHAAAHKHVYLMERQPMEAIRNNARGTKTIAEVSRIFGVEAFVLISTDKAINPTSIMGVTKRLAELHLQALQADMKDYFANNDQYKVPTRFMAVRFGNVLGSSGSVVPIFRKQIESGGPVTVTHPDVTRYFMTIPEAVGLVMQAAVLDEGKGTENSFSIYVLDMGQPVRIIDLAKQMIELSGFVVGDDIEIKFTGLKPGEKLFEELQHKSEDHIPTTHPRIMRFVTKGTDCKSRESVIEELEKKLYELDNNEVKRILKRIIPEYTPHWD